MFYDNTYSLGKVFQAFLKDQPDILDDIRNALCGKDQIDAGASDALLSRFERWIDEQGSVENVVYKEELIKIAKEFVILAFESDKMESLILV